jgi:colicin import membrane protein
MSTSWEHDSAQKTPNRRKRWLIIAAVVLILLILLLVFAPAVLMLLSIAAFIIALIALITGRLRWARIPNRRVAGGLMGGLFVLFLVSTIVFGTSLPPTTADRDPVAATPSPTATIEPSPVSLVGEACDADDLVKTEGTESIHCDDNGSGNLAWVSAADHETAKAKAQEEADHKAAAEKKSAEKKMEEKVAAEKKAVAEKAAEKEAAEKAAAEKKATEKAAAEKAAAEKKAAEKKAAEQAAAEKKAAEQRAAEKAAAERAAAAERKAATPEKAPTPAPAPRKTQAPAPQQAGTDPRFGTCAKAKAAGYGPYVSGRDPEYNWYRDSDSDGVNCER